MLSRDELEEILFAALKQGGDFSEVFFERKIASGIACEADKIERITSGLDIGVGIRVISGENTSYAYTNDLSLEALKEVAEVVARAAKGGNGPESIDLRIQRPQADFKILKMPDTVPVEKVNW